MRKNYEFYRRHRCIKTSDDILNLIKGFPGISFTEIQRTTMYNSGKISNLLRKLDNDIIIVKDETRGHKKANKYDNIKSMYFHKDMKYKIEKLLEGNI